MRSIRTFLVVVLLATMTLVVFIAALRGYRASMSQVEALLDGQLVEMARLLDSLHPDDFAMTEAYDGRAFAFQVWVSGKLLKKSLNTPDELIAPLTPGYRDGNFSGYRWRILAQPGHTHEQWILVAQRADLRISLAEEVILEAVLPIIVSLPLAGVLIWLIVGRGLQPLRRLAQQLGSKRSDDLSPLPIAGAPAELRQVIDSTNSLFNRLALAFDREKRFAADAAHELRTPISVLKIQMYNLSRDLQRGNPNLDKLNDGIERVNHLVEQILALYRSTPEHFMANFSRLDLHALARDTISRYYDEFRSRDQQIELAGHRSFLVGDRFALETLLHNLLSNASKYTPSGGQIRVAVQSDDSGVVLCVEDSGPGIAEEEYERVFERFYRIGGDRHVSGVRGCGLGLAIVQHITELHEARIELGRSSFTSGLAVNICFPLRIDAGVGA